MAGIILEIRKKISGVKNTRKITKAMQLVAASKMRHFQKKAVQSRQFVFELLKVLHRNIQTTDLEKNNFTEIRNSGPTLFVVYTSDKGLCGPLNNNLLRSLIRSEKWLNTEAKNRLLITIGKKSRDFARINNIEVAKSFQNLPDKLSTLDALKIIDEIIKYWQENRVKEIVFLAPHYKNSFTYYPVFKTLLPFSLAMIESHLNNDNGPADKIKIRDYMIYEPSRERVLNSLFEHIIEAVFIQSFIELKASEYSSRMIAMQNATDSADEMIHDLTLTYNKTRQQVITQELAELIGASEALAN